MITKEHIEQAKRDTIQIFDDLLANFEEEKYAIITNAYWENGKIVVEYETNIDIDVRYWFGDKVHEAEDYVGKIEQTGRFEIGVNQFDKDWNVQLIGDAESEVVNVGPLQIDVEPFLIQTLFGFYDGYRAPENVSLYKTYLGDDKIDEMIDQGKKLALMISGFEKENGEVSDYEIERRWKAQEPALTDKIREAIAFVYVMDEPYHKGYDLDFQQRAIESGRKIFGDFKYGYSYMEDHVMNKNKPLAKNADFVGVNNYLFRQRSFAERYNNPLYIVESKEDFFRFENELLERIKDKVGDKEILITAQGISIEGQYAEPPTESPFWYAELMKDNPQIKGILYYNWIAKHNESKALKDMPELYENIQKAFK